MTTQLRQRFGSTAPLFKSERMSSHVTDPETFSRPLSHRSLSRRPSLRQCICISICLAALIVTAALAAFYYFDVFTPEQMKYFRVRYSIMFDAGSTGSRMHIFQFHIGLNGEIRLINETFSRVSPGLSDYASDPPQGAWSLKPMLNRARIVIPAFEHQSTTLSLKATAGLRLLSNNAQEQLLKEVRDTFRQYPFISDYNSVNIMDGQHEGYYAWLMVAFTLGRELSRNSIATLDLGGGSTQITFQPQANSTLTKAKHLQEFKLPGGVEQIMYVHSYLGGGLMYGRAKILKMSAAKNNKTHFRVSSPCIHPNVTQFDGSYWEYFGIKFEFQADKLTRISFDNCYLLAKSCIDKMQVFAPEELPALELYLMSYYFDRAVETGLIQEGVETHKNVTVRDFRERADSECTDRAAHLEVNIFLCVDLTYIYALLRHGLKLPDNTKITVAQKLRGSEVSWALGAALSELQL